MVMQLLRTYSTVMPGKYHLVPVLVDESGSGVRTGLPNVAICCFEYISCQPSLAIGIHGKGDGIRLAVRFR
jgi:hypothetical protein